MHKHYPHPWQRSIFAYGTPGRRRNSMDTLVQNTTWGLPCQYPQAPWALQNFLQMLEFTHLAPRRAPWDTRELAEQDIIKTEAFQNSPTELQKRKKKKQPKTQDTASNTSHRLPGESKMSSWRIKEKLYLSCVTKCISQQVVYQLSIYSTASTKGINTAQSQDLT